MISGVSNTSDYWQIAASQSQKSSSSQAAHVRGASSLDMSEVTVLAGKISDATGQSVSAEDLLAELDIGQDGRVSRKEFAAAPSQGPAPPIQGTGDHQGADINALLELITGSREGSDSSTSTDPLDTNGDGRVDFEEFEAGLSKVLQNYLKQAGFFGNLESAAGSQLSLQV